MKENTKWDPTRRPRNVLGTCHVSNLLELGRLPMNVLGDGNCFFRAVSCQLYNSPEYFYPSKSLFRPKTHIVMFWLFKYKT